MKTTVLLILCLITQLIILQVIDAAEAAAAAAPDFSPSNTYLETSFDVPGSDIERGQNKVPPPTLPKPKLDESTPVDGNGGGANTLERRIRNITQV